MEIVDAHQHVGSLMDAMPRGGISLGHSLSVEQEIARRVAAMDKAGVDWAVLQPSHGYLKPDGLRDTMRVNDRLAEFKRTAPTRFRVALGTVEPMYGEHGLPEIDRCKTDLGLDGLSWHHRFQGCYIDSPWMWPILERLQAHKMAAIVHVNAESSLEAPWRLQRLAREFPDLAFIALDGLWSYERAGQIVDTASQTPNVVWDLGGPATYYTSLESWVQRNGSESVCFSADLGYGTREAERPTLLGHIERAKISDRDRENILSGNIRRVFQMA